jgi:hypothetical protein
MYITEVLNHFNLKVESVLFPFMASIGYVEYEHSADDQTYVYSKYEFKKGNDYISFYLGLNRLDYNNGIQVSLYTLGGEKRSMKDFASTNSENICLGYSEREIDDSMERIKECLSLILRTT